jgi:manganese/zinc/iron transport system permease protein
MLGVAAGVGVLSAIAGRLLAVQFDTNTAGMMAVVAGVCFAMAVVLSPRYGLASKMIRNARTSLRIFAEDLLGILYRLEELAVQRSLGRGEAVQAVGGGLLAHWELSRLMRRGYVVSTADGLRLTDQGRRQARGLVRSHRLWEAYLVEHLGLPHDHVHAPAERMEHFIDERLAREISERLSDTAVDPHGRDIPANGGD